MNLKKIVLRTAATAVVGVLLAACINPFTEESVEAGAGRTESQPRVGSLSIDTGGDLAVSTVRPTTDILSLIARYDVLLENVTPGGLADITVTGYTPGTGTISDIPTGTWNLTVTGLNGSNQVIAIGRPGAAITINAGTNATSVPMHPQMTTGGVGTGTVNYTLDFSAEAAKVDSVVVTTEPFPIGSGTVTTLTGGSEYTVNTTTGALTWDNGGVPIDSGLYAMTVQLQQTVAGSPVNHPPIIEIVQIYDYLESTKSVTINAGELNSPPAAPNLHTGEVTASNELTLSWTDTSNTEEFFAVYREGVEIATVAAGVTTYTDTGVVGGTIYNYEVRGRNAFGDTPSATRTFEPIAAPTVSLALNAFANADSWTVASDPGDVQVGAGAGAESFLLYLSDNQTTVTNLDGGAHWVELSGGTVFDLATLSVNLSRPFVPGTVYYYRVVARNSSTSGQVVSGAGQFTTRTALYVSTTGSDTAGGSATAPLLTVGEAISIAEDGETINVAAGTYNAPGITLNKTGLSLIGAGDATIINDSGTSSATLSVTAADITVQNLQITVSNANTRAAISISGTNASILGNLITESATSPDGTTLRGISGVGTSATISGNRFVFAEAGVAPVLGTRYGFNMLSANAPATPGIFENNRMSFGDAVGSFHVGIQPQGNNFAVRNNVVVQEGTTSTATFNGFRVAVGTNDGNQFVHNTVVNANPTPTALLADIGSGTNTVLTNNIFASIAAAANQTGISGSTATLVEIHANAFWGMSNSVAGSLGTTAALLNAQTIAAGNVEINPALDAALRPTANTPFEVAAGGVNDGDPGTAGNQLIAAVDYDGVTRTVPVSIGAYESTDPEFVGSWSFVDATSTVGAQTSWSLTGTTPPSIGGGLLSLAGAGYTGTWTPGVEQAQVFLDDTAGTNVDKNNFTLAFRFRMPDPGTRPEAQNTAVLIGGSSWRWLRIRTSVDGGVAGVPGETYLRVLLNNAGAETFEDIGPVALPMDNATFTTVVMNFEMVAGGRGLRMWIDGVSVIDDPVDGVGQILTGFAWNNLLADERILTWDYAQNAGFVGDFDWVFVSNGQLSPALVSWLQGGVPGLEP